MTRDLAKARPGCSADPGGLLDEYFSTIVDRRRGDGACRMEYADCKADKEDERWKLEAGTGVDSHVLHTCLSSHTRVVYNV